MVPTLALILYERKFYSILSRTRFESEALGSIKQPTRPIFLQIFSHLFQQSRVPRLVSNLHWMLFILVRVATDTIGINSCLSRPSMLPMFFNFLKISWSA